MEEGDFSGYSTKLSSNDSLGFSLVLGAVVFGAVVLRAMVRRYVVRRCSTPWRR